MPTHEPQQFVPTDVERARAIVFGRDKEKIALYSRLPEKTEEKPSSSLLGKLGGIADKLVLEPYREIGKDIKYFSKEIASPFATKLLEGKYAEPILRTIGKSKVGEAIDRLHQTKFGEAVLKPLQRKLFDFYEGRDRAPLVPVTIEEAKQFAAGGLNLLTGGIVDPDVKIPQTQGETIAKAVGEVAGLTAGLGIIQNGVLAIAAKPAVLGNFVTKFPTLAKYFIAIGAFNMYGQLDPELSGDISARLKKIAIDTPMAIGFTALGGAPLMVSLPASFGIGYGFAKLGGADNTEALTWGIALSVLDAAGRVGGKGRHGMKTRDMVRITREQAEKTLSKEGFKIKERYTDIELGQIRRQAAQELHPDRPGGDVGRMSRVNWAVDILKETPIAERMKRGLEVKSQYQMLREELTRLFGRKVAPVEATAERPVPKAPDLIEPPGGFPRATSRQVVPVGGTVTIDGTVYNLPTPKSLIATPPSDAERIINTRIVELNKKLEDTKLSGQTREELRMRRDLLAEFSERINPQLRKIIDLPEQIPSAGRLREEFNEVARTIRSGKVQTPEQLRAIMHFQYTVPGLRDEIRPVTGRFHPRLFFDEVKKYSPKLYEVLSADTPHARVMNQEMEIEKREAGLFNAPARPFVPSRQMEARKAEEIQKKEITQLKEAAMKVIMKRTEIPLKIIKKWLAKHNIDPRMLLKAKRSDLIDAMLNDKPVEVIEKGKSAAEAKDADVQAPAREKEVEEKMGELLEEMKAAKPGKRVMVRPEAGEPYFIAEGSTFPDWVPSRLRLTELFEKVIKGYQENIVPKSGTREAELYDLVEREASERAAAGKKISADDLAKFFGEEQKGSEKDFIAYSKIAERVSDELTTKVLDRLGDRTKVSSQFVEDLLRQPDVRKPERELLSAILKEYKDGEVDVVEFKEKVKAELLPLKTDNFPYREPRYVNISLSPKARGSILHYFENIYESPIKTRSGNVHFPDLDIPNYFAHTRVEDVAGKTRRVIEIQSDLFQKGRLEGENRVTFDVVPKEIVEAIKIAEGHIPTQEGLRRAPISDLRERASHGLKGGKKEFDEIVAQSNLPEKLSQRESELSKLEPYRNTWHERIIREEVKKAAQDGKTKLQFPTGETAMKIEGLGERDIWYPTGGVLSENGIRRFGVLKAGDLKVEMNINRGNEADQWIITDILGDGKFKAVPKDQLTIRDDVSITQRIEGENPLRLEQLKETFDISGKIDVNNPIYRFYEKEVGKYLTNKYDARRVTDPQGVEWREVEIKPEMAQVPIAAFRITESKARGEFDMTAGEIIERGRREQVEMEKEGKAVRRAVPQGEVEIGGIRDTERLILEFEKNISQLPQGYYDSGEVTRIKDFIRSVPPESLGGLNVDLVNAILKPNQLGEARRGIEAQYANGLIELFAQKGELNGKTFAHEFSHHYYERFLTNEETRTVREAYQEAVKDEKLAAELFGGGSVTTARTTIEDYVSRAVKAGHDVDTVMEAEVFARLFERYYEKSAREQFDEKVKNTPFEQLWNAVKELFGKAVEAGKRLWNLMAGSSARPNAQIEELFRKMYEPGRRAQEGIASPLEIIKRVAGDIAYQRAGRTPGEYLRELENTREAMTRAGEDTKRIDERIALLRQEISVESPAAESRPEQRPEAPVLPLGKQEGRERQVELFEAGEIEWKDMPAIETNVPMPKQIQDSLPDWKDAGWAFTMARETMERNIDRIAGDHAPAVKGFLTEPTKLNETAKAQFVSSLRKELRKKVVDDIGIRVGSNEDMFVMRYGEGRMTFDELKKATPKWAEVVKAERIFRDVYDSLLNMVNGSRAEYGYEPIPKREYYFRHFQEIGGVIKNFGLILRAEDLPTEISGLTGLFKPGKPFSTAELRRLGMETTESAIKGMDNYLDSISRQIFHIDTVQRGRSFEKVIRESSKINRDVKLPNFVANVLEWTNLVSGKKAQFDRAFESLFGRQFYGTMNWVRSRTSANMIAGNVSSALTNFIPITQLSATTGKQAVLRGLGDAVLFRNHTMIDGQESGFLARRFPERYIDTRFLQKGLKKEMEMLGFLFNTIDKFSARLVVGSKYYEKRWEGLKPGEAMKAADAYAAKVMTDRSIGQMPNLFGIRTVAPITQFQSEINNQFSFITKDIPKQARGDYARLFSMMAQLAIYSYLFNDFFQKLTGRRVAIDPIYAAMTLVGYTAEGQDEPIWRRIWFAAKDIKDNLPFTGSLFGGRFPISAGVPDVLGLLKGTATFSEEIMKPIAFLASPAGGGLQAKKSFEGTVAWLKGGAYIDTGRLRYPVEQDIDTFLKLLIFGQYSAPEAKLYFNEELGPLGPKETRYYQQLLEKGLTEKAETFYNQIIRRKKATREIKKLKEEIEETGELPDQEILQNAIEKIKKAINAQ